MNGKDRIESLKDTDISNYMKIRNILRYIGTSLLMVSALMLVSGLISLYYGGDDSMMPLFY